MRKPTHSQLVKATADSLSSYVARGVSLDPIITHLDPNINIEGLDQLLEYYFLLTGRYLPNGVTNRSNISISSKDSGGITDVNGRAVGVLDFISLLPHRLRTIDPSTRQKTKHFNGKVRGRVDWNETMKYRYGSGDPNGQRYACRIQQRTVDTTNNRVLIELLSIIDQFVERLTDNTEKEQIPDWFSIWKEDSPLYNILQSQLNNVYLSRLTVGENAVTTRELSRVEQSREPLYREAAVLLKYYRRIKRVDLHVDEIKQLLGMELFAPSDDTNGTSDLYELYWIFKILDRFGDVHFKQIKKGNQDLIATWEENGSEYLMFNDWDGKYEQNDNRGKLNYLDVSWGLDEIRAAAAEGTSTNSFNQRAFTVLKHKRELANSVFNSSSGSKTPDIVLLKLDATADTPRLEHIFIGEVKWSTNTGYLKDGLEQLLEYGAYAKLGTHLSWADDRPGGHIAKSTNILDTPGLELGYFVGSTKAVSGSSPPGIQVYGFGDTPDRPFSQSDEC